MTMLVVDWDRSEHCPQRRKANNGRLLHCCCICGRLDTWGDTWSCFCSEKELDDEAPIPKFCSRKCQKLGGPDASNVTTEMKREAKDAEWREPHIAYREATDREKYHKAASRQAIRSPGAALGPPQEGQS
jgi:hypothetical protein